MESSCADLCLNKLTVLKSFVGQNHLYGRIFSTGARDERERYYHRKHFAVERSSVTTKLCTIKALLRHFSKKYLFLKSSFLIPSKPVE